jgi:hypothetical protein
VTWSDRCSSWGEALLVCSPPGSCSLTAGRSRSWKPKNTLVAVSKQSFIHSFHDPLPTWWSDPRAPVLTGWAGGPKADALLNCPLNKLKRLGLQILGEGCANGNGVRRCGIRVARGSGSCGCVAADRFLSNSPSWLAKFSDAADPLSALNSDQAQAGKAFPDRLSGRAPDCSKAAGGLQELYDGLAS